ncbi:MFS general substrate transporter [Violaceomyces palustris]|uniref:MFS general substrate transporter n=1 Tax=Violaceomyces palustris TaxID=1673888 RepID=A0ACD0NRX5_9BASI|nr:MFS general substrate transporter [Violaceomyces palustris]
MKSCNLSVKSGISNEQNDQHRPLPLVGLPLNPRLTRHGSVSNSVGRSRRGTGDSITLAPLDLSHQASRASQTRPPSPHYPASALALTQTKSMDPGAIYIDWELNDPSNPFNWPTYRKWTLVIVCFLFTACTAFNGTGYPAGSDDAARELHSTAEVYLVGNTTYLLAISFTPLVLAPLSEVYGRTPIYLVASFVFMVTFIPQALAPNMAAILISRWFQGMAASVGNSMVAGSVSDMFHASERGFPMGLYALSVYIAQGVGPTASAFTTSQRSWRVILWWNGAVALFAFAMMALLLKETRGPVLLSQRAKRLTEETGKLHRCRADDERSSFPVMVKTSLVRPIEYLFTEPVVTSFALWIGFLWGIVFICLESVPIAFSVYGWSVGQKGLVLLCTAVGGLIGFAVNFYQEKLYARACQRHDGKPPPEARLYSACAGAVFAPVGLYIFAWTARSDIHPVAPILGLLIFNTALFPIYLAVFSYLADVYERYASSALAAQSFLRNTLAATFPLFSRQMYSSVSPPVASTILASIGALLGVVPFILLYYGEAIRKRSRAAVALEREEREAEEFYRREEEKLERRRQREASKSTVGGVGGGCEKLGSNLENRSGKQIKEGEEALVGGGGGGGGGRRTSFTRDQLDSKAKRVERQMISGDGLRSTSIA